ncbi:hypothetical protein V498_02323 [Pseudogymnoascus sp. VKM F-4517 (FW-2822)]|nr:hypothetical protein V498_02323 [Pseudogymnoascus sp. VKM F-4517 (FW-2822)]
MPGFKAGIGIPTGYLGNLEQRLNETEAALYSALAELRSLKNDQHFATLLNSTSTAIPLDLAPRELNANKMSRMAEWKEHPLTGPDAIERWQAFFSRYEIPPQAEENIAVTRPPVYSSPAMDAEIFENIQPSNHITENAPDGSWEQLPGTKEATLEQERQGDVILNPSKKLSSTHRYTYY